MAGWIPNYYRLAEDAKREKDSVPTSPQQPNPLATLKYRRFVTDQEAEWHYISLALGELQKEGFVFALGLADGWLSWPPEYLDSVMAHYYTLIEARRIQKYEVEAGRAPDVDEPMTPEQTEQAQTRSITTAQRMVEANAKKTRLLEALKNG